MDPFARSAEPLPISDEDRYALRSAEQSFDESRRNPHQMLAIVEYDENATILDCFGNRIDQILLQMETETEGGSGRRRHLCLVVDPTDF